MTQEKIWAFVDKVYKQCIDEGMTCKDFGFFILYLKKRKGNIERSWHQKYEESPLPTELPS